MLLTVLRSLRAENQPAIGNTLVIPSLVKIHRHQDDRAILASA
jgi:hypothetical protein